MAAPKGHPRYGGRKKGTPNKLTADVRAAIMQAFDAVGGAKWLETLARRDPKAFSVLLTKVIPNKVEAEVIVLDRMTDAEQRSLAAALAALAGESDAFAGGAPPTHH